MTATRSTRRTAGLVAAWTAVGVLGTAALVGVAAADTAPAPASKGTAASSSADSAGASAATSDATGLRRRLLAGRVLHGEATVKGREGYQVAATQLGTVTAVTKTSLTVRSEDGVTWTWALGSDTRVRTAEAASSAAAVKDGVQVRVVGPVADGARTARLVVVRAGAGA